MNISYPRNTTHISRSCSYFLFNGESGLPIRNSMALRSLGSWFCIKLAFAHFESWCCTNSGTWFHYETKGAVAVPCPKQENPGIPKSGILHATL
ncbi:MAG: hypothetical protein K2Z81_21480, partial [Cyanobacteria bacterium]|nr:hypothetical protein [Cyanobacteriota bacterium]